MEFKSKMDQWCYRRWIKVSLIVTVVSLIFIAITFETSSTELLVMAGVAGLIPLHVVEEWVFPGGLHYAYNYMNKSDQLDRYPMSRIIDMYTNMIATFYYVVLTIIALVLGCVPMGFVIGTIVFCVVEVCAHTMCGVLTYRKFKEVGKTTIYGPGSITAYAGFGFFGILLAHVLILNFSYLKWMDLVVGVIVFLVIAVGAIALPERFLKKKDNNYPFFDAGYYERFLH